MKKEGAKKIFKPKNRFQDFKKADLVKKTKRIFFLLLLLVFLGVSLWVLFLSPLTKIQKVEVDGFEEPVAREIAWQLIGEKYFGIIPKDNLFLLPANKIRKKINEELVLAEEVSVKRDFPDVVSVDYIKREGVVTWCQQRKAGGCFLIDKAGKIFLETGSKDYLPIIFDRSNAEIAVGESLVSAEMVNFCYEIGDWVEQETEFKLVPEYATPSFVSDEIETKTENGLEVFFNTKADPYRQARLLEGVIENNIGRENVDKIKYIDLRVEGKVIYKEEDVDTAEGDKNKEDEHKEDE